MTRIDSFHPVAIQHIPWSDLILTAPAASHAWASRQLVQQAAQLP
jgi:hypothetical protein